ncbi:MAG: dicarboxylate/amino acid:cation symporter [bacterium]|nr:dicarboxylate/amino acid:cation symporter [bacterium]
MNVTLRVLVALIAGLIAGVIVAAVGRPSLFAVVSVIEPVGTLWVNGIRMTVIPLVVSLLISGIGAGSPSHAGRIGGRAIVWFVVLVAGGALLTAIAAPPLLALAPLDTGAFASLRDATEVTNVELPPFSEWIVGLVPSNPVQAAASGAMLPLIIFSVIFALAVTRLERPHRSSLVDFFTAISRAMLAIVDWLLIVAPVGVFCLVLPLAANTGIDLVGAMGNFLMVACGLITIALLGLYPIAALVGGVSLRQFTRACVKPQAVGFSTRSSLASLPAMLDAAEHELGLEPRVSGIALPVATALFKFASPIARITGTFFVARLYGIDLGAAEIVVITAAIAALSFYSPGVPSGGLFIMTPVYIALNLPVEGIGLLIALDLIPDMFITTANVTANMTVAVVLRTQEQRTAEESDSQPAGT